MKRNENMIIINKLDNLYSNTKRFKYNYSSQRKNNNNKSFDKKIIIIIIMMFIYFQYISNFLNNNISKIINDCKKLNQCNDYNKYNVQNESPNNSNLKIFIMTHKDFNLKRRNSVYTIVADDKSQLKKKYNLSIIYAENGKLYKLKRAYGEMSKLYYIYQLYKTGEMNSKYIGLNHYRRYFKFNDDIPDLDDIFKNYDVILNRPRVIKKGMRKQFCKWHICKNYDEIIDIIKDIKPDYYESANKTIKLTKIHYHNLFIMKKSDFFKYCEFMYDVLFEFDRRHNLTSDEDVLKYVKNNFYQSRLQGFLSERIANIFYFNNFKKIKLF